MGDSGDGDGLRFLQINLNHCKLANQELENTVDRLGIDIVLCQDPYIFSGKMAGIPPNWRVFLAKNNLSAIIITNNNLNVIQTLSLNNVVFVNINVEKVVLSVGSQYSAPSGDLAADFDSWTSSYFDCTNVLIGGDFNVPMRTMGYSRDDSRTETLLEFLSLYNLKIINDTDSPPTYVQDDRQGRPDLTLAGDNICNLLDSWTVESETDSFSDHKYIRYKLNLKPTVRFLRRYKTKYCSFAKFNENLEKSSTDLLKDLLSVKTPMALDNWTECFQLLLTELANKHFKLKKIGYKPKVSWYTKELKADRNKVNACYKRYKKNLGNIEYKENYIKARNCYKKKVKIAKRNSWMRYCETTMDPFGGLFKYISGKTLKQDEMIFTTLENNTVFDTYDDVAHSLMEAHFDVANQPSQIHEFVSNHSFIPTIDFPPINKRELKYALSRQALNKAPGYDLLDPIIIKNVCKKFSWIILPLFNKCLSVAHFPRCWKRGLVLFFRKRNKDPRTPRAYRPITLLPVLGKIFERILNTRIVINLEYNDFFDTAQHGFRANRSTETAVLQLKNMVRELLSRSKYCAMSSLDIEGAFDALDWFTLADVIDRLPIHPYLKLSLKNYISHRQIGFQFVRDCTWFSLSKGCPQGSCLGPLLWILVSDQVLKNYRNHSEFIISYADDFVIFAEGNSRSELENNMNTSLDQFANICERQRLTISTTKSVSMLFGKNTLDRRHPIFRLRGESISVQNNIKYLGLTLDSRFNWLLHLDIIRERVREFAVDVKRTGFGDRGLQAGFRKIWYKAVTEKVITYGHRVWFEDLKISALKRLSSCQRIGLLFVIKSYRTVSTDALCTLAGIPPIHLELQNQCGRYGVINGNNRIIIDEVIYSRDNLMQKLKTSVCPFYNKITNLEIIDPVWETVPFSPNPQAYTDGSKMELGVSSAFTIFLNGSYIHSYKARINKSNTIYQAELLAIYLALRWFMQSAFYKMILYTDSSSSVSSLENIFPTNKIIFDIYGLLHQNPEKFIQIAWIKAHAGIDGNERADQLAKSVLLDNQFDEYIDVLYPVSLVNRHFKNKLLTDWQEYWSTSDKGRDTYEVLNKVDVDFVCTHRLIIYFISGHGSFPSFLYKIGKLNSDRCPCGSRGTPIHYIFGKCKIMPHHFHFDRNLTLRENLQKILFSPTYYRTLADNYNVLNEKFSFIRSRL